MADNFIWYELMTTDVDAAKAFYGAVVGWTMSEGGKPGMPYTLVSAGPGGVGGVMALSADALDGGARPAWMGYIGVGPVLCGLDASDRRRLSQRQGVSAPSAGPAILRTRRRRGTALPWIFPARSAGSGLSCDRRHPDSRKLHGWMAVDGRVRAMRLRAHRRADTTRVRLSRGSADATCWRQPSGSASRQRLR